MAEKPRLAGPAGITTFGHVEAACHVPTRKNVPNFIAPVRVELAGRQDFPAGTRSQLGS